MDSALENQPKILLVEDNAANITTMVDYLNAKGYNVLVAEDGRKGVDKALAEKPDLILMDIQMPGMDGLEAMQLIRQDATVGKTPIIAITALAMKGDRERCLQAGADAYVSKPLRFKELIPLINQLLTA